MLFILQFSSLCLKGQHLRFYKLFFFKAACKVSGDFTKNFQIFVLQANLSKQSKPDLRVFPVV